MERIKPYDKSIEEILSKKSYLVDYYQREYKWQERQIIELLDDLSKAFFREYHISHSSEDTENYSNYFLGSIIISNNKIVDGQQRLTSIVLILIYFYNLLKSRGEEFEYKDCILSQKHKKKTFSLNIEDRVCCLDSLVEYNRYVYDSNANESIKNMCDRYDDIISYFEDSSNGLRGDVINLFIEWFVNKVYLIELKSQSETEAYEVFVSMNDRGLNLMPIDMLKSYLINSISNDTKRHECNHLWKEQITKIKKIDKNGDSDFIRDWFRAQYADVTKGDSKGSDSEKIGKMFHRWLMDYMASINKVKSDDFYNLIIEDFKFYSDIYIKLKEKAKQYDPDYEYLFFNAHRKFTLQNVLILSAINISDDEYVIEEKIRIVSCFVDQLITSRIFQTKTIAQNSYKNTIYKIINTIRGLDLQSLSNYLKTYLISEEKPLSEAIDEYSNVHPSGKHMLHTLARLTYFVEKHCNPQCNFNTYIERKQKNSYDIEHIIPDKYAEINELYPGEYDNHEDFYIWRNNLGALLILPKDKNRSYQDMPYSEKVIHYDSDNILARSLNENCYKRNPSFLKMAEYYNLNFRPYSNFSKKEIKERQSLYKNIALEVWNIELLNPIFNKN